MMSIRLTRRTVCREKRLFDREALLIRAFGARSVFSKGCEFTSDVRLAFEWRNCAFSGGSEPVGFLL